MKNIAIKPEDYTILAVDDIATNIMLLKAVLSRAKYKIVTASGGYEAIEKASKEAPDLILLDIMMPDLDGYEVIKHLKADPATQDIPVIFLTALHNPEDIVKGFKLGASDYVSKPFNHEELITRVTHHIYLAAAQRTIMQQRDELQATVDARDKMYSVIAHDLRSPIGTLKMVFNMLLMNLTPEQIGEENLEMVTMGNNITESTFMLLDNLLKWTKSQTGRMNSVFQEVDISEVVVFASKMSDLVAQVKSISVEYDIPGPISVNCDVDMVKTIIRNLMSNAIKYSNEGGRIIISVRETPTHARISVRDFGTGIREEDIPKLLNPEIHYTTYGTKNEEGSGLGLQLVQDLTRRNGRADHRIGGGRGFDLHLHDRQGAAPVRNRGGHQRRHRPTVTRRGALRARNRYATADAKPGPNRAPRLFFAPRPKSGGANVPPPRPSSYRNKTCRPHARHPAPIQTDAEAGKAAKAEIYLNRSSAITTLWSLTVSEGM